MNASDIIENYYKIIRVDMGPSTLEGDVYHADFSVHALIKRAQEQKKKNPELQSQVHSLKDFISSIINLATREASSSHMQGLDPDTVKEIKGNLGYAKAVIEWIDEMYRISVSFISKFRVLYVNVWNKRKELLVDLQQVEKEHGSVFVLSKEVTELTTLGPTILMTKKLVARPKEIDLT